MYIIRILIYRINENVKKIDAWQEQDDLSGRYSKSILFRQIMRRMAVQKLQYAIKLKDFLFFVEFY